MAISILNAAHTGKIRPITTVDSVVDDGVAQAKRIFSSDPTAQESILTSERLAHVNIDPDVQAWAAQVVLEKMFNALNTFATHEQQVNTALSLVSNRGMFKRAPEEATAETTAIEPSAKRVCH